MATRLPHPGSDAGTWGSILNSFLEVAHNSDGSLKSSAISAAGGELTSNKGAASGYAGLNTSSLVPSSQLGSGSASNSTFLRGDGTWATPSGSGVTLASDTDVNITNPADGQVLTYDGTANQWENKALPTAPVTSVANKTGDVTLTEADIANLSTDLGTRVQIGGDLSGSATNPTVAKLKGITAPSSGPTGSGQVLTSTGTSTTAWQAPPVTSVANKTGNVTLAESDITNLTADLNNKLTASSNLSDLGNAGTARTNLGLGTAATANIGNTAGTVAAGNDSRITGALQSGTSAGGDLSGNYPSPTVTSTSLAAALPVTQGGTGASSLSGVLKGNGTSSVTGSATLNDLGTPIADFSMGSNAFKITGLHDPGAAQDAATKNYVDSIAQGLSPKQSVEAATAAALPNSPTYNNGTSGVGATLTAGTNGALTIDTYTVQTNDRILVKDEQTSGTGAPNNGIYVVTQTGDGSTPYILTRSADFNQPSEVIGAYVFVVNGSANVDAGFVCNTTGTVTFGTTAVTWTQFSSSGTITAGTGLNKVGPQMNLDVPVAIGNGGTGQQTQQSAIDALTLASGNANKYLRSSSTGHAGFDTIHAGDLPTASTSTQGAVLVDGTNTDVQSLGTQSAGTFTSGVPTKGVAAADHVHPMPRLDQIGAPTTSVAMNNQSLTGLADGVNPHDAAAFHQIPTSLPPGGTAGGDLTSSYPNPTVAKIRNITVSTNAPTNGQVLTYNSTNLDAEWTAPAVTTVFNRAGAITAQTGDYTAAQVGAMPASDDLATIAAANPTSGDVAIGNGTTNHKLTNVLDPTNAQDAATKNYVDLQVSGSATPDASATTKGKLELAGDLTGGTAASPTVSGIQGHPVATGTPTNGQVLQYSTTTNKWSATTLTLAESSITGLTTDLSATEKTANKGAASGYAPLDGTSKVPIANLPTGTTSTTVAIGNDSRITGAIQSSTIHAKGDLLVGTASSTLTNLTVGTTNGQVLTVDSTQTGGVKWATLATGASAVDWINAANAPYNADTTGGTDAATAIQNALNAAPLGGVVYLPAGTYQVTKPIIVPPTVSLVGSGRSLAYDKGSQPMTISAAVLKPTSGFSHPTYGVGLSQQIFGVIAFVSNSVGGYGGGYWSTAYSYTATHASPCVFTAAGSAYANGTQVVLSGTVPGGFTAQTQIYYVVAASGTSFELSLTSGGAAVNSTSAVTTGGTIKQEFGSANQALRNITIDGTGSATGTRGVESYGPVWGVLLEDVGIFDMPDCGLFTDNGTETKYPDFWTINRLHVAGCHGGGVNMSSISDTYFVASESTGNSGGAGWALTGDNIKMIGCKAEYNNGIGLSLSKSSSSRPVLINGFGTDGNTSYGIQLNCTGGGAGPFVLNGVGLNFDGEPNSGFAGLNVVGSAHVSATGLHVTTATSGGNTYPTYGVLASSGFTGVLQLENCEIYGGTAGISNASTTGTVKTGSNVITGVGDWSTQTTTNVAYSDLTIVKPANTARTNNTLAADPDLTMSVAASTTYEFEFVLYMDGPTGNTVNFGLALDAPTGATGIWGVQGLVTSVSGVQTGSYTAASSTSFGTQRNLGLAGTGTSNITMATVKGTITTSTTAGTFDIKWAQQTSNATAVTLYAGSYMKLKRIE